MTIALFVTATGKYTEFLPKLFTTAEKYFMTNHQVVFVLFTDEAPDFPDLTFKLIINKVEKTPFPYASMNRCKYYTQFLTAKDYHFDYCYAIDADAYFAANVGKEIFFPLVAVRHCAKINLPSTFETNPKSACFVPDNYTGPYLGGGFYGGESFWFYFMNKQMAQLLEKDAANGIIPLWHDESALNHFFYTNKQPRLLLNPSYHYPEWSSPLGMEPNPWVKGLWDKEKVYINEIMGQELPFKPKIVFVEKGNTNKGADYYRS